MTIGLLFWILMVVWVVFGASRWYQAPPAGPWGPAWDALSFVLFLLLGVAAFGWPIRG
jgi:hypothetical protein